MLTTRPGDLDTNNSRMYAAKARRENVRLSKGIAGHTELAEIAWDATGALKVFEFLVSQPIYSKIFNARRVNRMVEEPHER
jgi:hypothetical protein